MKPPRHWVPDALYDVVDGTLSMAARTVYGALCRCVTKGEAQPSVARLAQMVGAHRTTVMTALAELEKAGIVVATRRFGAASRYVLPVPAQWKVPLTSRSQRLVEQQSLAETGRPQSLNRSVVGPEPVAETDTLGSTSGSTAGSGVVPVALSKKPEVMSATLRDVMARIKTREPGTPIDEIRRKAQRELDREEQQLALVATLNGRGLAAGGTTAPESAQGGM